MTNLNDIAQALSSSNWTTRSSAIKNLEQISIKDALPFLDIAIKDEHKHVRQAAIELMNQFMSKDCRNLLTIALLDDYYYNRQLAFTGLMHIYDPSLFELLNEAINRPNELAETRMNMIWSLRFLQNDFSFTPTIIHWMQKQASKLSSFILMEVICEHKDNNIIPAVLEYGKAIKTDPSSYNSVVKMLGSLKATEGLDFILQHAGHQFSEENYSDTYCLNALVEMDAAALYFEKFPTYKGRPRNILVEAIGQLKFNDALAVLTQQFQKTKGINYKISLAKALYNLDYQTDHLAEQILIFIVTEQWDKLPKEGNELTEVLAQVSKSHSYSLARKAIQLLGDLGQETSIQALCKQVKSSNNQNRLKAIEALGKLGSPKGIPALVEYLNSDGKNEPHYDGGRAKAIRSLVQIGDLSVIPFLTALLKENPSVSGRNEGDSNLRALIKALGNLYAEEAIPTLVPFLSYNNQYIVAETVETLNKVNWTPDHLQNNIRWLAANKEWDSIVELGDQAVKPLMRLTEDHNCFNHEKLMLTLAQIGNQQALEQLLRWLFKPHYKHIQLELLEKLYPFFQPLFGELTENILKASSFIDCIIREDARITYYTYSLKTAIEATRALQTSNTELATKVLKYIPLKQAVSLTESEHEEYGGGSIDVGFESQFENLKMC